AFAARFGRLFLRRKLQDPWPISESASDRNLSNSRRILFFAKPPPLCIEISTLICSVETKDGVSYNGKTIFFGFFWCYRIFLEKS
ncbi:MAG: hypothetical protein II655_12660, partial [Thermoguttaceae bacterium]|nr:hypothetical protein [Thermoguttaceae bacterium]